MLLSMHICLISFHAIVVRSKTMVSTDSVNLISNFSDGESRLEFSRTTPGNHCVIILLKVESNRRQTPPALRCPRRNIVLSSEVQIKSAFSILFTTLPLRNVDTVLDTLSKSYDRMLISTLFVLLLLLLLLLLRTS